ncbi:hypothetical protein PCH_Pc12g01720, partial [Penicillium rubens Wisconsin 54-1255]
VKKESHLCRRQRLLERFAINRGSLGLAGKSVELSVTRELGYMSLPVDLLENFSSDVWIPINRALASPTPSSSLSSRGFCSSATPVLSSSSPRMPYLSATPQSFARHPVQRSYIKQWPKCRLQEGL